MRLPTAPVLAVLPVLLAGCSPGAAHDRPTGSGPVAATPAAGSRGPHPGPVTRAVVGLVLRDLGPLRGFAASAYCLDGGSVRCDLPADPLWTEYAEWRGPRLGHGTAGTDAPRAFYLVGVLVHRRPDGARALVRDVERRSPAGPVHEPVRVEGRRTYTFGRRGRAVVRSTRVGDWTGVVSVSRVDLLRLHERPVRDVVQVDTTLHRGRVSVQVLGWLDGATGPDPAVALDALTRRVLQRLDQPYAALLRRPG